MKRFTDIKKKRKKSAILPPEESKSDRDIDGHAHRLGRSMNSTAEAVLDKREYCELIGPHEMEQNSLTVNHQKQAPDSDFDSVDITP